MSKPRIFIGAPVYDKVDHRILEDWMRFMFHCGRRMPQFDFELGIKPKSEQFRARNAIVEGAQQTNCDWLLMLDDDMVINPYVTSGVTDDYGFIEKLIAHDKDICGIRYYQRGGECAPVLMKQVGEKGYRFLAPHEIQNGLQRVDVAGGGCLMIKTKIFDRLKFPYFAPEYQWGTDIQLCRQATEKGFEVWADTSIEFGHVKHESTVVTSRNRLQHVSEDIVPGEVKKQFVSADIYTRLIKDASEYTGYDFDNVDIRKVSEYFMGERKKMELSDADWYREFPKERVVRQVWFNTTSNAKRTSNEMIVNSVNHKESFRILDFGCGIGLTAFTLAEKGHDVTAMDIRGTGTFEFLKWRAKKHGVHIRFIESEGGVPDLGSAKYDVIVAMDCIEHIKEWREVVGVLSRCLGPNGALFANNGVMDDKTHAEHYDIDNKEFIAECMASDMMPFNQITFVKKEVPVYA